MRMKVHEFKDFDVDLESVEFIDGYGVVTAKAISTYNGKEYVLKGLVNKQGRQIIDFRIYHKDIVNLGEGNIVTFNNRGEDRGDQGGDVTWTATNLYKVRDTKAALINSWDDKCQILGKEVLVIWDNKTGKHALFDIKEEKVISDWWNEIEPFKTEPDSGVYCAQATLKVELQNWGSSRLICFINQKGKFVSPIYSTQLREYVDPTTPDFSLPSFALRVFESMNEDKSKHDEMKKGIQGDIKELRMKIKPAN